VQKRAKKVKEKSTKQVLIEKVGEIRCDWNVNEVNLGFIQRKSDTGTE
jgi:hypothetical protein